MPSDQTLPVLATHGGKFHCDEVFAYAVLRLATGMVEPGRDHVLVRTRDPRRLHSADIVWDVGFTFDPAARRFDHHQPGAPTRPDGTPFSSAGLIWRTYGERAVAALLDGSSTFAAAIAAELDESLVRRIDETDNGVSGSGPVLRPGMLDLSALIADFNPPWDAPAAQGPSAGDDAFLEAASFATDVLRRRVRGLNARLLAEADILAAHAAGEDPRILTLDRGMPWKTAVLSHGLPVLFTVSPASNGNWMVDTVPTEPGSFEQRHPLPARWAGLQAEALATESGVADAVFVHLRRFVGAARSRAGALDMARLALPAEGGAALPPGAGVAGATGDGLSQA